MTDWLALSGVGFRYGAQPVFADLSFTVSQRVPVLAVIGPSGIGKSTLLGLLAGHLSPQVGTVSVHGTLVEGPSSRRTLVFQDHNLFPWKTVMENITFGLKCLGVARPEREERGAELLKLMRMEDVAEVYPASLSGGMQQRVALARALAVEPDCLLLDEPFHALDPEIREALRNEVIGLVLARAVNAVLVTHDLADAVLMAGAVLALRQPTDAVLLDLSSLPLPRPAGWPAGQRREVEQRLRAALASAPRPGRGTGGRSLVLPKLQGGME